MQSKVTETVQLGGVELTLETGEIARQAHGAVVVREGRSFLLATVVAEAAPRPGQDFFPLTVEYREKMAAGGRIPGAYGRREGRISDREVLTSRLIDRTLRPLFAEGFRCDTQVMVTVYGADEVSDLESLALIAASAALHVSDLPFDGPVGGLRLSRVDGQIVALARPGERRRADLDFIVSASRDGLVMVEGEAAAVPDEAVLDALDAANEAIQPLLDALDRLRARCGKDKRAHAVPARDPGLAEAVRQAAEAALHEALAVDDKHGRRAAIDEVRHRVKADLAATAAERGEDAGEIGAAFEALLHHVMRARILDGHRIGGRAMDAVRDIAIRVGLLESNHGSALFTRGETQALVSVTLGGEKDALDYDTVGGRESDPFMLHYNFPPFSVGEARPNRGPGRREIGHGNLARRALAAVLPDQRAFPYTLRIVSDITESNGSSSMATVCGGCLALMDAGVPVREPVAGIAMGLIAEGDRRVVLSDILGDEDHLGDMDFKVAGTASGVTAVQLDNKLGSLPREVFTQAIAQARRGLTHILGEMGKALGAPRAEVAAHAPQVATMKIDPKKIGAVIGSGGSTIKDIQGSTRTRIDIAEDGSVRIFGQDAEGVRAAMRRIEGVTLELTQGAVYVATVVSIKDFGCFVRIGEHEGLVHVSELEEGRVANVSDVVSVGDEVLIRVTGTDNRGRLQLSRRAALGVPRSEARNA